MARLIASNFEGNFPALDRKKLGKPSVVDGNNFLVDLDGPRSAFGWDKVYSRFDPSHLMQAFTIGDALVYFSRPTDESFVQISNFSWLTKQVSSVQKFVSSDFNRPKLNYPWTHAFVGTYHYFANRTWGVLRYDAIEKNWEDVTNTIGLTNVFFITESGGRLCTLSESFVTWSAIDDGMDNVPSIETGAGAQAISAKVGELERDQDYLGIVSTVEGFLSFTARGIVRSDAIDSVNPFRHLKGDTKYTPMNPWCIAKINDADVTILSRFGLFISTNGVQFTEFQPLHNEYLKQTEIPALGSSNTGFISLHYSRERDELHIALAKSQVAGVYTKTWVFYLKRESWGLMNHAHKGYVEFDFDGSGVPFQQAFIDTDGQLSYLSGSSLSLALEPANTLAVYVEPPIEYPPFQVEGVWVMATHLQLTGFSRSQFPELAGFYEENGEFEVRVDDYSSFADLSLEGPLFGGVVIEDIEGDGAIQALVQSNEFVSTATSTPHEWITTIAQVNTPYVHMGITSDNVPYVFEFEWATKTFTYTENCSPTFVDNGDGTYTFRIEWTTLSVGGSFINWTYYPDLRLADAGSWYEIVSYEINNMTTGATLRDEVSRPLTDFLPQFANVIASLSLPTGLESRSDMIVLGQTLQPFAQYPLNSFVEVGLFRFTNDEANDQFGLVSNVAISCLDSTDSLGSTFDDWFEDYEADVFEDWEALTGSEDWGSGAVTGSNYTQQIRGSLDGYETFEDQFVEIDEVKIAGKTKFCSTQTAGLFHSVRLNALEVGESFHLKSLELNGILIGRL